MKQRAQKDRALLQMLDFFVRAGLLPEGPAT